MGLCYSTGWVRDRESCAVIPRTKEASVNAEHLLQAASLRPG